MQGLRKSHANVVFVIPFLTHLVSRYVGGSLISPPPPAETVL